MASVTVRGTTIAYDDTGTGEPAFVFIHGWACDRSFWQPQIDALSSAHRCVAIDLRGRGESTPTPPFDVVTAADDVAAVMEEIGLERAIIVAHSLGGIVALLLNDRHPGHVLGIVTGDSPIGPEFGQSTRLPDMIREAGAMDPAAGFIESFFRDGTPEEVRQHVRETMLSTPSDVGAGMLTLPDDYDFDMLRLLTAADEKPFMAIWAADRALGDIDWIRANTVFIRHEPVTGAGHFFQLERPEVTTALLRAFIDDVERDPRIKMAG